MAAEARPHQKLLRASGDRCCSLGTSSQRPSSPSRSAGFSSATVRTVSTHWMRVMLRIPPGTRTHRQAGFVSLPDRAPAWRVGRASGRISSEYLADERSLDQTPGTPNTPRYKDHVLVLPKAPAERRTDDDGVACRRTDRPGPSFRNFRNEFTLRADACPARGAIPESIRSARGRGDHGADVRPLGRCAQISL